jgi:transposase
MSKWKTEDHFVSWLRPCSDNRISGDKIIGKGRLPTNNRISRLRTNLGAPVAIKAMAAKVARLVYRMLRYGMKYVDQGAEFYESQRRQRQSNHLEWKAAKLGFQIIDAPAA